MCGATYKVARRLACGMLPMSRVWDGVYEVVYNIGIKWTKILTATALLIVKATPQFDVNAVFVTRPLRTTLRRPFCCSVVLKKIIKRQNASRVFSHSFVYDGATKICYLLECLRINNFISSWSYINHKCQRLYWSGTQTRIKRV